VVDVVRAHHEADEFLLDERVLVRGLGRGEASEGAAEFEEALRNEV
jgi:hypothetical protein